MSGFQPGGPGFGPPFNYGGQYMPQFHGSMPYNNNGMMPQQGPLQQPQFPQHRPPPFPPPMPQAPNQVHFANNASFNNNSQFPQPGFQQGPPQPPPPPPQYYNYGQYNNHVPGPPYTPTLPGQGFGGVHPAPLNHSTSAVPTPQPPNIIPHTSSASGTPIRSTFIPQRSSLAGPALEMRRESESNIHGANAPGAYVPENVVDLSNGNMEAEGIIAEHNGDHRVYSENVPEPVRQDLKVVNSPDQTKMGNSPETQTRLVALADSTEPDLDHRMDEEGVDHDSLNTPQQRSDSSAVSKEDSEVAILPEPEASPILHPSAPAILQEISRSEENRLDRREQAKRALRDLDSNKIGFLDLSAENLNLDFLKQLYLESGLPITLNTDLILHDKVERLSKAMHFGNPPSQQKEKPIDHSNSRLPERPQPIQPLSNNQVELGSTKVPPPVFSESPRPLPDMSTQRPTPSVMKKSTSTDNANPLQGRKDYVARLLAAKAGIKHDSSPVQSKPSESLNSADTGTRAQENTTELANSTPKPELTIEAKKPELKDPKQTELIRQRLEALKNSSKTQTPSTTQASMTDQAQVQKPLPAIPAQVTDRMDITEDPIDQTNPTETPSEKGRGNQYDPSTSFFAPTNRTPSGGLPGLPGLSGFSLPAGFAQPTSEEALPVPSEDFDEGEIVLEEKQAETIQFQQIPSTQFEGSESTPTDTSQVLERTVRTSVPPGESRKRPTAADFIDEPPRKVLKRPSSDPIRLVIEVSDNEDDDPTRDENNNGQTLRNATEAGAVSQAQPDENINNRRGLRELPPLSDFPARNANFISKTPKVQTPSLAEREEQIRQIKLRIVEAELRKKSKKAGSETPAASEPAQVPPTADASLAQAVDSKQQAIKEVNEQLEEREKALALAKRQIQEKIEAERQNQTRIAALAEQERQEAAQAATLAERQARLDRKATLEAALPNLDAQIKAARDKLEDMKRQQEEIQAEIRRGNEGRKALMDELSEILKALETNGSALDSQPTQPAITMKEPIPADQANASEPLTEKTSDCVSHPPKITVPPASTIDLTRAQSTPRAVRTEPSGDVMDIASSSEDEGQIIEFTPSPSRISREQSSAEPTTNEFRHESPRGPSEESLDDYEPTAADPAMDAGGLYESANQTPIDDIMTKGNEEYEPSLDVEIISSGPTQPTAPIGHPAPNLHESTTSSTSIVSLSHEGNLEQTIENEYEQGSSIHSNPPRESEISEEGEISDDYEPPEVSYPVDTSANGPENLSELAKLNGQYQGTEAMDVDAEIHKPVDAAPEAVVDLTDDTREGGEIEDENTMLVPQDSTSHFVPYESPLRQFLSYRFHPQYAVEVQGGFQSLSFNHKIKPNDVMCRWELAGGICNDSSCEYQHFRDLNLSDNTLLLQLGSVHEGSTGEEKADYIAGLKQIIAGMRDKNLRDVNAIASEIVAYRSRFLDDPSRVLTNI